MRPPKVRKQEGLADAPGPSKQSAELEGSTKLLAGAVEKSRLGRQRSAPDAVPFAPEVEAPAPDAKGAGSVASPPAPAKGWKGRIKGQGEAREAKAERSKSAPPRSASEAERGVAETGNSLAPSSSPAKDEEGAEDGRMAAASSEDLGPVDLSLRGGRSLSGQLVYRDAARLILLVEGGQMVVVARAEVTRVERGAPGQGDASAKRRRVTILLLPEQGSEAGR